MIIDLNFYPEDYPDDIAAIPYIVADCDLTGFRDFADLVEAVVNARLELFQAQWEVNQDGDIISRITGNKLKD
jgi:hypothetical protein